MTPDRNWHALAELKAAVAHEIHFHDRYELSRLKGLPVACYKNNNPYKNDPTMRADETDRFRDRFKQLGFRELAYAEYPQENRYSFAMLIALPHGRGRLEELQALLTETLHETDRKLRGLADAMHEAPC